MLDTTFTPLVAARWLARVAASDGVIAPSERKVLSEFAKTYDLDFEQVVEIARSTGIENANVLASVKKFMEVVKDTLAHGIEVTLRGFGTSQLQQRAEKTARNIVKNTTIIIPAHKIPDFKPAEAFKKGVK